MEALLDSSVVKLTALAASYLALAGGIKKIADWIEDFASEKLRHDAYEWLSSLNAQRKLRALGTTFSRSLRSIFGDDHWTIACFLRVVLATLFVICFGSLLLVALRPQDMSRGIAMTNPVEWAVELLTFPILLLANYLSLWKTRLLIRLDESCSFSYQAWLFLLLELICSFAFVVLALNIANVLLVGVDHFLVDHPKFYPRLTDPLTFSDITWRILTLRSDIVPLWYLTVPSMWAAFVPAAMLSLFLLSRPILRVAPFLTRGIGFFRESFDIKRKPFKSMAAAVMIFLAALYVAILAPLAVLT